VEAESAGVVNVNAVASSVPPVAAAYQRRLSPFAPAVPLRMAVPPEQMDALATVGVPGAGLTVTTTVPFIKAMQVRLVLLVATILYVPAVLLFVQVRANPVVPFVGGPMFMVVVVVRTNW
jgi:hypothetical protein